MCRNKINIDLISVIVSPYYQQIVSFCKYTAEEFDISVYLIYQDISSGDKSTSPVSSSEESNPDPEASAITSEFVVAGSTFILKKDFWISRYFQNSLSLSQNYFSKNISIWLN